MTRAGRVVDNGDGTQRIDLSGLFTALILAGLLAGASALVTVGVLAWRASADEVKMEKVEIDVARQGRNQMRLDASQRRLEQDTAHANAKLDGVLRVLGVTKRVPRPALPPSSLEEPNLARP